MKPAVVPIRCVDVVAALDSAYVVIERFTEPRGLAFPGGKIESGESAEAAIVREFFEETGLLLAIKGDVGLYDAEGRDPRGPYISKVFHGVAIGTPKSEAGKTHVLLITQGEIESRRAEFILDHFQMFCDHVR
jgi:8-oxo-dGTP diphosphatase